MAKFYLVTIGDIQAGCRTLGICAMLWLHLSLPFPLALSFLHRTGSLYVSGQWAVGIGASQEFHLSSRSREYLRTDIHSAILYWLGWLAVNAKRRPFSSAKNTVPYYSDVNCIISWLEDRGTDRQLFFCHIWVSRKN